MTAQQPRPRWYDRVDRLLVAPRLRFVSIAMLIVMGGLWLASVARGGPSHDAFGRLMMPDLLAHMAGGRLVVTGQADHLYDAPAQIAAANEIVRDRDLHLYLSPPFVAWMYAPFALIPYRLALVAWLVVLVAQLSAAAAMLRPWTEKTWSERDRRLALLVALSSGPALDLFGSGQDTGLSLVLWVAGASLSAGRRDVPAGLVFALGWFKPQLFLAAPFVLAGLRRWRALVAYLAGSAVLAAATLATAGVSGLVAWRALFAAPAYRDFIVGEIGWKMQSLPALFRSFVPSSAHDVATVAGVLVALAVAAISIVRTTRALPAGRSIEPDAEMSLWALVCLATIVASPHLFLYDLVLAVFPCVIALQRADARTRALVAITVLISWTSGIRGLAFAASPWPLRVLASGFSSIPLLALALRWPTVARRETM